MIDLAQSAENPAEYLNHRWTGNFILSKKVPDLSTCVEVRLDNVAGLLLNIFSCSCTIFPISFYSQDIYRESSQGNEYGFLYLTSATISRTAFSNPLNTARAMMAWPMLTSSISEICLIGLMLT